MLEVLFTHLSLAVFRFYLIICTEFSILVPFFFIVTGHSVCCPVSMFLRSWFLLFQNLGDMLFFAWSVEYLGFYCFVTLVSVFWLSGSPVIPEHLLWFPLYLSILVSIPFSLYFVFFTLVSKFIFSSLPGYVFSIALVSGLCPVVSILIVMSPRFHSCGKLSPISCVYSHRITSVRPLLWAVNICEWPLMWKLAFSGVGVCWCGNLVPVSRLSTLVRTNLLTGLFSGYCTLEEWFCSLVGSRVPGPKTVEGLSWDRRPAGESNNNNKALNCWVRYRLEKLPFLQKCPLLRKFV